jgi:hypothetical protein
MYKTIRRAYKKQIEARKELEVRVKGLEGQLGWKLQEIDKLASRNG